MSPVGSENSVSAQAVWRGVIVFIGVVLFFVIVGVVVLFGLNRSAIEKTNQTADDVTELSCRLGSFFIGQAIVQQPEQSKADFVEVVGKGIALLRSLRDLNCEGVSGASITARQLHRGLQKLRHARAANIVEGGGALQPGSNPGQQPGPGEPAPKPHHPPRHQPPEQPDCDVEVTDVACVNVPDLP